MLRKDGLRHLQQWFCSRKIKSDKALERYISDHVIAPPDFFKVYFKLCQTVTLTNIIKIRYFSGHGEQQEFSFSVRITVSWLRDTHVHNPMASVNSATAISFVYLEVQSESVIYLGH